MFEEDVYMYFEKAMPEYSVCRKGHLTEEVVLLVEMPLCRGDRTENEIRLNMIVARPRSR